MPSEPDVTVSSEMWLTWGEALKLVIFFTQSGHASKPSTTEEMTSDTATKTVAPRAASKNHFCSV